MMKSRRIWLIMCSFRPLFCGVVITLFLLAGGLNGADVKPFEFDGSHPMARRYFRVIESGLPANADAKRLTESVGADRYAWQFAWFTYGEIGSRSIVVALRDGSDLFVDFDRNYRFKSSESISNDRLTNRSNQDNQREWRFAIDAEYFSDGNNYQHAPSLIWLRTSDDGSFEVSTSGVMFGRTKIGEQLVNAVRIDRNSNACWFDADDRIVIDKDGDQILHPIGERIACNAVCRIGDKRFVLHSDILGQRLDLVELSGQGTLVATLSTLAAKTETTTGDQARAKVVEFSGTIVSRSGIRVSLQSIDDPIECPVGEYRVQDLSFEIQQAANSYLYRFSSMSSKRFPIEILKNQESEYDLLGEVRLSLQQTVDAGKDGVRLTFTPMLKTTTGLYLTNCMSGEGRPSIENRLRVDLHHGDTIIDRSSTGFS